MLGWLLNLGFGGGGDVVVVPTITSKLKYFLSKESHLITLSKESKAIIL